MKNTSKILLVLTLVLAFAAMFALAAAAEVTTGKVNANDAANDLQWAFDSETKTLKITGTSTALTMDPVPAWNAKGNIPWSAVINEIEHVVVEAPIESICTYAFSYLTKCTDITLPNNEIDLKDYYNTFAGCGVLNRLGPAGTPEGVIDLRNFTGTARQCFEGSFNNLTVTLLMPAEGASPISDGKVAADSATLIVKVVEGSPSETWAKNVQAKATNEHMPDNVIIEYYDGTYDASAETTAPIEDTTAPIEDTTAPIEDTTAPTDTPAAPGEVTIVAQATIDEQYSKCTWVLTSDGTITFTANASGWNEVPYDTKTENRWYDYADQIKKVVIGAGLQKVGKNAFKNCVNLEVVEWASISQLAEYAFNNCPKLTTIYKKGNEPVVGTADLSGIGSVNGANQFINCGFTSVDLNNKMTKLHENFFVDCAYLTNVTIGATAETVSENTFPGCYNLKVVFGESGSAAETFATAKGMTFAKIGDTVEIPEAVVTTAAPETTATPETTPAPETSATPDTTTGADGTTKAPDEATQTGDINLVMVIAIAMAALASAVVLMKKRSFN